MTPLNPIVEALVCRLDDNLREAFEERAGVMQFEAGKERELAESLAVLDVIRMFPLAVSSIAVLQGTLDGAPVAVLAVDVASATARLDALGATGVSVGDLPRVLASLGGAARLTPLPFTTKN